MTRQRQKRSYPIGASPQMYPHEVLSHKMYADIIPCLLLDPVAEHQVALQRPMSRKHGVLGWGEIEREYWIF